MDIENFSYLPDIDERSPDKRLSLFEKARAIIPGRDEERIFYVAGVNRDGHIVLSTEPDNANPNFISSTRIGIEPQYIQPYKSI